MKRILISIATAIALPSGAADLDPELRQERRSYKATIKQTVEHDFLLHLPKGYADSKKTWPLILFLHGAGERGDDLAKVAFHGPPKLVTRTPRARQNETPEKKAAKRQAMKLLKENFVIVSPQCPQNEHWHGQLLSALLDHIESDFRIDKKRIYLTGLSMGGYGTWELGLRQPERFAAIAPICGGLNSIGPLLNRRDPQLGPAQKRLPIWIFHGGKDSVVIPEESEFAKRLMERLGNQTVKLTIYPEAGHDSWTDTYANPELYRWFLSHSLP